MLRIALLQFGYETNTFIDSVGTLYHMSADGWTPGDRVVPTFEGKHSALSGAIAAIRAHGAEPVGIDLITRGGTFNAGPILSLEAVTEGMDHICRELEARQDEYDGVYFAMHGAGCAQGLEDADSYYLQRIRQVVGSKPIMCSLDLHANMTPEMVSLADGLFGIKELPHTDFYQAGYLAADTLIRFLRGECRPQMVLRQIPMLLPSTSGVTLNGPLKETKDHFAAYVKSHNLLDATFFHGFSATDSSKTFASVLTVADGFAPEAEATELAGYVWNRREDYNIPAYSAAESVDRALAMVKTGYVVINEGSDNPGAGCPGDGTHLLAEFFRRDLPRSIMGPLFDPEAAAICHTHKVGDTFTLRFGGKSLPIFGDPIEREVTLLSLCDGTFQCATPVHKDAIMCYGSSARLRSGNVEFILVSRHFQTYDDRPFLMTGANMADYSIVALKSMNHFRAYFLPIADGIVTADTPSSYPADLNALPFRHISRPIFPLDPETQYTP